ncbi:MAG TPA: hypothetical protein VN577_05135 [Terriglobales bacterium]|nr:hypothetical protein [Terriglobales bacterium]
MSDKKSRKKQTSFYLGACWAMLLLILENFTDPHRSILILLLVLMGVSFFVFLLNLPWVSKASSTSSKVCRVVLLAIAVTIPCVAFESWLWRTNVKAKFLGFMTFDLLQENRPPKTLMFFGVSLKNTGRQFVTVDTFRLSLRSGSYTEEGIRPETLKKGDSITTRSGVLATFETPLLTEKGFRLRMDTLFSEQLGACKNARK